MNEGRPRVLQVLGRSAGGIARHVAFLTETLQERGVVDAEVAGPPDLPVTMPDPFHRVTIPDGPTGHRAAVRHLRTIADEVSPGVVHAHGLRAGIDSARAVKKTGIPVIVTIHNLIRADIAGPMKARLYRIAERLAVRRADHVFCVSGEIAEHLRETVPSHAHKIEVLYLGVGEPAPEKSSREEIRAVLGLDPSTRLIVTASRLSAQKALPVMFEALAGVPNAVLAVLGEGPQEGELRVAAELVAPGRVLFLGFQDTVGDYIRAADAFCLSSVWEGVPLAAQEAILVETPVVATAVGGMPELIEDGVSGRLAPKNDVHALRDGLVEVLAGGDRVHAYTERALKDLQERFSTKKMVERLEAAYLEAVRS